MLTRRGFLLSSGAALMASAAPAWAMTEVVTLGGDAFGSYWRLTLPAGQSPTGLQAIVAEVDALFSPYRPDSALSLFNAARDTGWLDIPAPLHTVLAAGLDIAAQSAGAFDPTVGPAVARFGFGPIAGEPGQYTELTLGAGALRKSRPALSIDLCGIAKGHALDLMAARLIDTGHEDFLLDLGGELTACGAHPSGRPWQAAIDDTAGGLVHALALENVSIATSGLAAQGYTLNGRTFGHIIDPLTDAPVTGATASVSVIAADATSADGWATALMAMPHARAVPLAESLGLETLFLLRDGPGLRTVTTGGFDSRLLG